MWKQLVILVLVLMGLIAWERNLGEQAMRTRDDNVRIRTLFNHEQVLSEDRPIAAFQVEVGGSVHLYLHHEGTWRCMSAFGAVALNEKIGAILPKLAQANGVIQTSDSDVAEEFGFDVPEMIRFAICGRDVMTHPTHDVIYGLDIGKRIPETGGSYVRPFGTTDIWSVDMDLREELEPNPESPLPPMVDPHVVPGAWPGFAPPGVERIVIEVPDQPPLELQRYEREVSEEEVEAGARTWDWSVKRGGREFVGDPFQVFSFGGFLTQMPYVGILAPPSAEEMGFDRPAAIITLHSVHGQQLQLIVAEQPTRRGGIAIHNTFSQNTFEVDPYIGELLVPEMDMLLADHLGNPWEPFLRRPERP